MQQQSTFRESDGETTLYTGEQILKKTKTFQQRATEILSVNAYKILYTINKEIPKFLNPYPQFIRVQVSSSLSKAQQFCPQLSCDIEEWGKNRFTIGKLERESVHLYDDVYAWVMFNCVEYPNEEMMSPIHLLVDYSNLFQIHSLEEHCTQIIHQMQFNPKTNILSLKTKELLAKSTFQNKQKIKIQDVSQMRGYPTCIQITQNCENQILEDGNIFKVGYQPLLTVRKIYHKFQNFFERYSTKNNIDDMIFEALQSLQSKVQFSGIDESVSELFMLVQDRRINKAEYLQRLEDENLMMQSKLYTALEKNSILLQTQRDENPIEHFLLVADQKNSFLFGRMEFSDITFQSTQVSRNHGTIEFIPTNNKWIIMDGQQTFEQSWKNSTFGVWLQMNPKTFYYIDTEQMVKVGSTSIKMIPNNVKTNNHDIDNVIQLNEFNNLREREIEDFTNTLLDL